MIDVVVLYIVVSILVILLYLEYFSRKRKLIHRIPGPPCLPIIGNFHLIQPGEAFFGQILYTSSIMKDYSVFKVILGPHNFAVLHKADAVEQILTSNEHINKAREYNFLHPWLGTGLLTSGGEKWKSRRRLITPTFHFKILNDFLHVFNEQSEVMVENLLKNHSGKGTFNIYNNVTLCALDIICETAMGISIKAQKQAESEYVKAIYRMTNLIHNRQINPLLWPDIMYNAFSKGKEAAHHLKILHSLSRKVIRERKEELEAELSDLSDDIPINEIRNIGKRERLAFLDMLLYAQRQNVEFTDEDVREEVDTFMFEGHDTTATAANWAIYLIGSHPEVQAKLHKEMDDIFGDSKSYATIEDLNQMKYLGCAIKEALRLFPSVPFFGRKIEKDWNVCGYTIPEGTTTIILTSSLHIDEKVFPDPFKFDPDRFLLENTSGRHPFAYTPFSAGPRNCIGQKFAMNEEKVMLSSILRKFRIKSQQKFEDLKPMPEIILRPKDGIFVKLEER